MVPVTELRYLLPEKFGEGGRRSGAGTVSKRETESARCGEAVSNKQETKDENNPGDEVRGSDSDGGRVEPVWLDRFTDRAGPNQHVSEINLLWTSLSHILWCL